MIDDYDRAMDLLHKMEEQLPISVRLGSPVKSLSHLLVPAHHPLAQEIRAYQRERARRIAHSGGSGEPSSFAVRPRKKRRR